MTIRFIVECYHLLPLQKILYAIFSTTNELFPVNKRSPNEFLLFVQHNHSNDCNVSILMLYIMILHERNNNIL